MAADLFGQAGLQITLRKALEELAQPIILADWNHGADAVQKRRIDGCVVAGFTD